MDETTLGSQNPESHEEIQARVAEFIASAPQELREKLQEQAGKAGTVDEAKAAMNAVLKAQNIQAQQLSDTLAQFASAELQEGQLGLVQLYQQSLQQMMGANQISDPSVQGYAFMMDGMIKDATVRLEKRRNEQAQSTQPAKDAPVTGTYVEKLENTRNDRGTPVLSA